MRTWESRLRRGEARSDWAPNGGAWGGRAVDDRQRGVWAPHRRARRLKAGLAAFALVLSAVSAGAPGPSGAWAAASHEAAGQSDGGQGAETTGVRLDLDEVVSRALTESAAARLAELDLNDARISYEQAKANNLLQGSSIALAAAESAWKVARQNYDIALQQLKGSVEEAYYGVLRARDALQLSERAHVTARRQLDVTEAELEQGLISEVDLLVARSELATAEANLAAARSELSMSRLRLSDAAGIDVSDAAALVDEFTYEPVSLDLQTFLDAALTGRVELVQARDARERSEQELQTKQNDYTPELEKEQAENARDRAELALRRQEAVVKLEVRQTFHAVESARRAIGLRQQSEQIARERLRIAELQRGAGMLTDLDVLDAEQAYLQAQTDSLQAVFDYNIALLELYRAAGMERP